jgi:hypothetical protein
MGITIKKHRRNLSYDDAATLSELWEITAQFDRSFYRELKDRWDERGYDEYIVAAKGRLPYCESPEQYVCRMETRREILAVFMFPHISKLLDSGDFIVGQVLNNLFIGMGGFGGTVLASSFFFCFFWFVIMVRLGPPAVFCSFAFVQLGLCTWPCCNFCRTNG